MRDRPGSCSSRTRVALVDALGVPMHPAEFGIPRYRGRYRDQGTCRHGHTGVLIGLVPTVGIISVLLRRRNHDVYAPSVDFQLHLLCRVLITRLASGVACLVIKRRLACCQGVRELVPN